MNRVLLIFCAFTFSSCGTVKFNPTPTSLIVLNQNPQNVEIISDTPVMVTYPPCTDSQIDQLLAPTSPTPDGPPKKLPYGLTIEEHRSYVYQTHIQDGGCKYEDRKFDERTIDLNYSYQITIQPIDKNNELVKVSKGGVNVFDTLTLTYGSSGLLQAWSYNDHWVIEIKTAEGVDIIRDGQSLKTINKYDKVFAFQLLADKPFYFFNKGNEWAVNYDDHELQLDYDDIPYTNVSDGMDPSVIQYQNLVLFQGKRGNDAYSVVIGAVR